MAAAASYPVRTPGWQLYYRGVNISKRVESMITTITYVSTETGVSPEVEVTLEDRDRLWQGAWFPTRGDLASLKIGYVGEGLADCGDFQVDEVDLDGPPDRVKLRCLGAFVKPAMRTPNTQRYESQTLIQIATTIASKYGLAVISAPEHLNVSFARVTQSQETDLEFLHRIAREHNYNFTVRGKKMVFYSITAAENAAALWTLVRSELVSFKFSAKTALTYKQSQVSYQDPDTKQLISASAGDPNADVGDTLKLTGRVENGQQAALKAAAALHGKNMLLVTGHLTCPGSSALGGGSKGNLSGFGKFDGPYIIATARHTLSRGAGYSTELEVRNVSNS